METQKLEYITPIMANEYLKLNTKNRKVSKRSLAFLIHEIKKGNWVFNGAPIIFSNTGALLDGQHRLMAIANTGATERFLVIRGVHNDVFTTIDSGRPRTNADALSVDNVKYASVMASAVKKIMNKYGSVSAIANGFRIKTSTTDIHAFYFDNETRLKHLLSLAQEWCAKGGSIVQFSDAIAMMWLLSEEDVRAYQFIEEVATGSFDATINVTVQTLRNRLIRAKIDMGNLNESELRDLYIVAFRHFIAGNEITKIIIKTPKKFSSQV